MIKFFRHIRQRLLSENKFSKYLLYATGEIVLVVIGILIALSINNWNEGRKDKIKEQVILEQLEKEYNANLAQLEDKMQMRALIVKSGQTLLNYIDKPKLVQRDSVILHISNILYDPTFDPVQNDLLSSGNLRLIRNDRLRNLLSNWSSDVIAVQESEQNNRLQVHEIMIPLLNDIGITRDVFNDVWINWGEKAYWLLDENTTVKNLNLGKSTTDINAQDILSNKVLEGVISNAISLNNVG
ncbi:MAG: hypothetical protein KJP26_12430, partial [Maribacter sp.]|nr:hypothetical protein [Maribacter sp.]